MSAGKAVGSLREARTIWPYNACGTFDEEAALDLVTNLLPPLRGETGHGIEAVVKDWRLSRVECKRAGLPAPISGRTGTTYCAIGLLFSPRTLSDIQRIIYSSTFYNEHGIQRL